MVSMDVVCIGTMGMCGKVGGCHNIISVISTTVLKIYQGVLCHIEGEIRRAHVV